MVPPPPPPPPGPSFDSPEYDAQQRAQFGKDSPEQQKEQIISECLEEILHRANLTVHQQRAHTREVLDAVDSCLATCLEVIEMQYPAREDNPVSAVSLEHGSWEQEKPPEPCSFDSWLRSALPEATPPSTTGGDKQSWVMQQFLMKQPSMHRSPSSRSLAGNEGDLPAGAPSASPGASPGPSPEAPRQGRVGIQAGATGGTTGGRLGGASTRSLYGSASRRHVTKVDVRKVLTPEQEHLEEQLRQELAQRRGQEEMSRRLEAKDAEERAKLASLRKELKGKDYTYDHKGEVVILNEFDPDRTPLEALSGPGFKVSANDDANRSLSPKRRNTLRANSFGLSSAEAAAAAVAAAVAAARPNAPLSPTEMRRERDRRLASDYKKIVPKTQPSALDTLLPAGGVTLRGTGGATKTGPLRPAVTGLTRDAYAKQVAKKALTAQLLDGHGTAGVGGGGSIAGGVVTPLGGTVGGGAASRAHSLFRPASSRSTGGKGLVLAKSTSGSTATAAVAAARAALMAEAAADPLAAYDDDKYDPFAGARAKQRTASSHGMGGFGGLGGGKPSTPDVNLSLVAAGDWGSAGLGRAYEAPPSLPHNKPTEKQLVETVGRGERLPRERAPLPTIAPPLSPSKVGGASRGAERLQFHSILAE